MGRFRRFAAGVGAAALLLGGMHTAMGAPAFSCGGFAQLGGAQLLCSHTDPKAPTQMCSFSWSLLTPGSGIQVVDGSFLLPRGVHNATVYQGSGFTGELSLPIVMCQAKKSGL